MLFYKLTILWSDLLALWIKASNWRSRNTSKRLLLQLKVTFYMRWAGCEQPLPRIHSPLPTHHLHFYLPFVNLPIYPLLICILPFAYLHFTLCLFAFCPLPLALLIQENHFQLIRRSNYYFFSRMYTLQNSRRCSVVVANRHIFHPETLGRLFYKHTRFAVELA